MNSDEVSEIIGVLQDIASSLQVIAEELNFMNAQGDYNAIEERREAGD